jgi:hypothetical protein
VTPDKKVASKNSAANNSLNGKSCTKSKADQKNESKQKNNANLENNHSNTNLERNLIDAGTITEILRTDNKDENEMDEGLNQSKKKKSNHELLQY